MTFLFIGAGVVLVISGLGLSWIRSSRRQREMISLLNAADALESRLRLARAEIESVAGSEHDPAQDALQEMLRQRLWLQRYGAGASIKQLSAVRVSIEQARARIEQPLRDIARARATAQGVLQ